MSFQFEIVSISVSVIDDINSDNPADEVPERKKAYFWLCGRCSREMTLALDPTQGLQLVPLGDAQPTNGLQMVKGVKRNEC